MLIKHYNDPFDPKIITGYAEFLIELQSQQNLNSLLLKYKARSSFYWHGFELAEGKLSRTPFVTFMLQYNFIRNHREKLISTPVLSLEAWNGLDLGTNLGTCPAWVMYSFNLNIINVVGKVKSSPMTQHQPANSPSLSACSKHEASQCSMLMNELLQVHIPVLCS